MSSLWTCRFVELAHGTTLVRYAIRQKPKAMTAVVVNASSSCMAGPIFYFKFSFLLLVLSVVVILLLYHVLITRFHKEHYRHSLAVGYSWYATVTRPLCRVRVVCVSCRACRACRAVLLMVFLAWVAHQRGVWVDDCGSPVVPLAHDPHIRLSRTHRSRALHLPHPHFPHHPQRLVHRTHLSLLPLARFIVRVRVCVYACVRVCVCVFGKVWLMADTSFRAICRAS